MPTLGQPEIPAPETLGWKQSEAGLYAQFRTHALKSSPARVRRSAILVAVNVAEMVSSVQHYTTVGA